MTHPSTIARDSATHCEAIGRRRPLADRFWEKVEKTASCWNWTAALDGPGYGIIGGGGRKSPLKKAHRLSWEIHNGAIPHGLVVMHKCDNRKCVNPLHLSLGTVADNNADRHRKGRSARTDGENSPSAKLTAADAASILQRSLAREPAEKIAERFGVSVSTVRAIKSGQNWPNLPGRPND